MRTHFRREEGGDVYKDTHKDTGDGANQRQLAPGGGRRRRARGLFFALNCVGSCNGRNGRNPPSAPQPGPGQHAHASASNHRIRAHAASMPQLCAHARAADATPCRILAFN